MSDRALRHIRALMIQRCTDASCPKFHRYGGRGIRVCERWLNSAADFIADVGPRPSREHSLDRINNDGDYEPGNVRWATAKQQQWNRSNNHNVTVGSETLPITEWARCIGISPSQIQRRIARGWSEQRACSTPITARGELARSHLPATGKRMLALNGETLTLGQWARRAGLTRGRLKARLDRYGWSLERAISTPVLPTGRQPSANRAG